MFGKRWRLFRLFGISINVDPSWLLIFFLVAWTVGGLFAKVAPDLTPESAWGLGLFTALAFFACIVLHELGHSLVARRTGIPVENITLFLFGGVAEIGGEPPSPGKEFGMAIAGPVVSAVLAAVFWALSVAGAQQGWPVVLRLVCEYLAYINVAVLLFNMVPAFPLDGGRVLRAALWAGTGSLRKATRWASRGGQAFAWLLIVWGLFQTFSGYGAGFGGLWLVLIGFFLNTAARQSYRQVVVRQALEGVPVSRLMKADAVTVPPTLSLAEWVEQYVYRQQQRAYPVVWDGVLKGVITTADLSAYPRDEWDLRTVGEAMHRDVRAVEDVSFMRAVRFV